MNKICLIALVLVVLCGVDNDATSVAEFFNKLPQDVSNAFTNAWHNIQKAIRKPVRIKRLGRIRKKKTTTTSTSSTTTNIPSTSTTIAAVNVKTIIFNNSTLSSKPYAESLRLEIPFLPTPMWRSINEWRELQKPRFAFKTDSSRTPAISMFKGLFTTVHGAGRNLTSSPYW